MKKNEIFEFQIIEIRLNHKHKPSFYRDFYCDSYPALKQSLNVDLAKQRYFSHFVSLTFERENAELYENTRINESRYFRMSTELSA
ncbi:TPA: hypothetical protein I7738_19555 [Vibrio vulnificus]|nr:hypothetical protein [Vibrio vulnificus]